MGDNNSNWEDNAIRFYNWCVKVGIDMSNNELVSEAYEKIK